jgi:hypothetical protein
VDALLVGYFDDQKLRFAGKVRAGLVRMSEGTRWKAEEPAADPLPFR